MQVLLDWLADAARGAARRAGRPARRHGGRLLRRRDRAGRRRPRQAHRRDRADDRLALAADLALPRGADQGRLVERARRRRDPDRQRRRPRLPRRSPDRRPGPAHHLGLPVGRVDGPDLGRRPRLVRLARPGRPRQADPRADAARPGHRRHAVHAQRGDHQPRDPPPGQGPGQDGLVLRRPRRLPDRRGPRGPRRGGRDRLDEALPRPRHGRVHRTGLRVARRRRPVALGPELPDAPRRAAGRRGLGHARHQPERHRLGHARVRRRPRPTRSTCRSRCARARSRDGPC